MRFDSHRNAWLLRTNSGKIHVMTLGCHGYALCGRYVDGIMIPRGEITCTTCIARQMAGATEPRRTTARRRLAAQLSDPHYS